MHRLPISTVADAHSHIHRSKSALAMIAQARRAFVSPLIVCSTSYSDWEDVSTLSSSFSDLIIPNYGVHPWWSSTVTSISILSELLETKLLSSPEASCGEIGLDMSPRGLNASSLEQQLLVFKAQLKIAFKLKRPISIHCVQAYGPLISAIIDEEKEHGVSNSTGILMHSFAGTCGFANQLLTQRKTSPILFSFNGNCVASAANIYDELQQTTRSRSSLTTSLSLSLPVPINDTSTQAKVFKARGLSKDSIKVLQRLPQSHVCFETDSPDQPFLHHISSGYFKWCREIFGKDIDIEKEEDDDLGLEAEKVSTCCSATASGDEGVVTETETETIEMEKMKEIEKSSTETIQITEKRDVYKQKRTLVGDGSGSLQDYLKREQESKENRPVLVRHVLRAAAILRYSYGSRIDGLPLQQKPGKALVEDSERKSLAPGLDFLALEPETVPSSIKEGLINEYNLLKKAATRNVMEMFTR
jgi:Tat protein secretion system quality control protein TatD with DNase activity